MKPLLRRAGFGMALLFIAVWSLGPIYWATVTSLSRPRDLAVRPPHWLPPALTWENYASLLGATSQFKGMVTQSLWPAFRAALLNSLISSVGTTVVVMVVAALAGYAFSRFRFAGRDLIFGIIVGTMALPAYAVMIPLYRLMVSLGLVDTQTGLILIYTSAFAPLAVWLMRGYYSAVPVALEEAAMIDGCSRIEALVRIVLPSALPGLMAVALLTYLSSWSQFLVPLVFAPTPATKPLTVLVTEFVTKYSVNYGLMTAAGVITILPPVVLVLFLNRYIVSGLTAGAVKG